MKWRKKPIDLHEQNLANLDSRPYVHPELPKEDWIVSWARPEPLPEWTQQDIDSVLTGLTWQAERPLIPQEGDAWYDSKTDISWIHTSGQDLQFITKE